MKYLYLLFFILPVFIAAQVTVVSTVPANNAKNVPLASTVSVTFSEAIDTVFMESNSNGDSRFSNIDSVTGHWYSADAKTMYAKAVLKSNHAYFIAFIYVKTKSGALLAAPFVSYFTTAADFPPFSVSGTVLSGSTGVSPEGSLVALSSENIMEQKSEGAPPFVAWANVNSNGTYSIPYVVNGVYWPIAVKDVNHDGKIDPSNGSDVMAVGDSVVVNGSSITNLNMTFINFTPQMLHESIADAETLAMKNLPVDRVLKRVSGYDVDTLGRSRGWEFVYSINGNTMGKSVRVGNMDNKVYDIDFNYFNWVRIMKPILNLKSAATSATVMAAAESAGGKAFRKLPVPPGAEMRVELSINDAKNGWFGGMPGGYDTSKIYWNVAYIHNIQVTNDSSNWVNGLYFLCDLSTGAVILSRPMGVADDAVIPSEFILQQNYPNPFNPATTIGFTLSSANMTTLKIYDLLGREVATLMNEKKDAGVYTVPFNASTMTSGVYFYQLRSGSFIETKKMMLVK
ncbi:MAG: T9SS type A sorting domain-containing protein [Bacteroidota bacterium]